MSLKNQWLVNISIVILSWFSLFFYGRENIKRFLSASIFIVFLEAINVQIGKKRKWWIYYNKPNSFTSGELLMTLGPFFVGSMWLLKSTYGNFKQFLLLNATIDAFFSFLLIKIIKKLKVAKLVRLNSFQFFLYLFYKAPLLYGFQYMLEAKRDTNKL